MSNKALHDFQGDFRVFEGRVKSAEGVKEYWSLPPKVDKI